jgi:hypothetical protein
MGNCKSEACFYGLFVIISTYLVDETALSLRYSTCSLSLSLRHSTWYRYSTDLAEGYPT